jgi:dynactin-5
MTSKSSFIQTDTGNLVSRASSILGSGNIILGGKTIIEPGVIIRGDLRRTAITAAGATGTSSNSNIVVVAIGKYTYLAQNSIIRPGSKSYKG